MCYRKYKVILSRSKTTDAWMQQMVKGMSYVPEELAVAVVNHINSSDETVQLLFDRANESALVNAAIAERGNGGLLTRMVINNLRGNPQNWTQEEWRTVQGALYNGVDPDSALYYEIQSLRYDPYSHAAPYRRKNITFGKIRLATACAYTDSEEWDIY